MATETAFPLPQEFIRQTDQDVVARALRVYEQGVATKAIRDEQIADLCMWLSQQRSLSPAQKQQLADLEACVRLTAAAMARKEAPPRKTLAEATGYYSRPALLERRAQWEALLEQGHPKAAEEIARLDVLLGGGS